MPDFVTTTDFNVLTARVTSLETNIQAIQAVQSDVEELVNGFRDVQAGFRVLGWLGKMSTPILWVIGVASGIVALFKVGQGK